MKKLMIGLALVTMASVPAVANSTDWRTSHDQRDAQHYVVTDTTMAYAPMAQGYDAYAYAPAPEMLYGPPPVYNSGSYQGTDPDPFVRLQLRRETPHEFGPE
jgi:hypothetical protein